MKLLCYAITLLTIVCSGAIADPANEPGVSVTLLDRQHGKGHWANVDLVASNPTDQPAWLVLGYFSNERLPETGTFRSGLESKRAFEASEYKEQKGSGIIINHYGTDHFKAIYLPAKGKVQFKKFVLEDGDPVREHDFMIVSRLLVNGTTPLEDWMPYEVKSSRDAVIEGRLFSGDQKILSWQHENVTKDPKPYPKEPVSIVVAEKILFRKLVTFGDEPK